MANLSEKWLQQTGGWQAMKAARGLVAAGAVVSCEDAGEDVRGMVRVGGKTLACGLRIRGTSEVTNLCGCPAARREGRICEHSLAVALVVLKGGVGATPGDVTMVPAAATAAAVPAKAAEVSGQPSWMVELGSGWERAWSKGRVPVLLKPDAARAAEAGIEGALAALVGATPGQPAMLSLDRERADALLRLLARVPGRLRSGGDEVRVSEIPARLRVRATLAGGEPAMVELARLPLSPDAGVLLAGGWLWKASASVLMPVAGTGESAALLANDAAPLRRPLAWFLANVAALEQQFQLESGSDRLLERLGVRVARAGFVLEIEGSLNHLAARLSCVYRGEKEAVVGAIGLPSRPKEAEVFPDRDDPLRFHARDASAEAAALRVLAEAGFAGPDADGQFSLRGEHAILAFYAGPLARLVRASDWRIEMGPRFREVTRHVSRVAARMIPTGSGEDWFAFDVAYTLEDGSTVAAAEIRRLLATGQARGNVGGRRIALDSASLAEVDEVLVDARPEQGRGGGQYRVGADQRAWLEETFGVGSEAERSETPDFGDLDGLLRDYQKEGARWLFAHLRAGRGALLADEMGLGKTLQTLAAVSALKAADPACGPALVVCPTSLIHTWINEAARFVPHLKTLAVHGTGRDAAFGALDAHDLAVTSYGVLARDIDAFAARGFGVVVLDEASHIRNPKTRAAQALRRLDTRGRVALTGTPVENALRDLWSIFQFAVPGYLGSEAEFRERYEQPIGRAPEASRASLERLRRRLRPFLLRRTKRAVASELPEKIEIVRLCELTPPQAVLYTELLKAGREKIDEMVRTQGFEKARLGILSTLLRLRQVCCDPRLLPGMGDRHGDEDSGKLAAFLEMLDEALEGGHRVLVFSQFVSMLALLRAALEGRGIAYCYLDGSTSADARAAEVRRFQEAGTAPVFLISLKAGGYGLTLTAADTVIHYDPWWNPAVEAQATDRAHRIGQRNVVTACKLIARGTVEERILSLQRRKRNVIDAAIDDDAPLMRGLSREDIAEILS